MASLTEKAAQRLAQIEAIPPCPTRQMLTEIHGLEVRTSTPSAAMTQVERLETNLPKDPL
jgi:hypothetical protein